MKSRLADQARQEQAELIRGMSPEQRLRAFMNHSRLVYELYAAGQASASPAPDPDPDHDPK